MGYKLNPFTGKLDVTDSPSGAFEAVEVSGDLTLGTGTPVTTVQAVTPTANRTISFPDQSGTVALVAGATGAIQYNESGAQTGTVDFAVDPDWNNASTTFTGLKLNVTDTASAAGSNLLDLQVGGTSKVNITKDGSINGSRTFSGATNIGFGFGNTAFNSWNNGFNIVANGTFAGRFTSNSFNAKNSIGIAPDPSAPTLILYHDAADTLAQRRGTNPQTYRLYNTYTDASNYERGFVQWDTNEFTIGSEGAGTGAARLVKLKTNSSIVVQAGGSVQKLFAGALERNSSSNHITWSSSVNAQTGITSDTGIKRDSAGVLAITNGSTGTGYLKQTPVTVASLPSASTVGAGTRGFVSDATATTFASVVAGSGSNNVPVYSDGTDWRIG